MDELDRLYRRLVHNVRNGFPELLTRPFEVQQLYQTLLPYRHHRKELEIETNEEYEIALMRLLSGERSYLQGDPQMQEALRQELLSPNPDTALFRMWASSTISLAPEALRAAEASPAGSMPGLRGSSATPGLRSVAPSPAASRAPVEQSANPPSPPAASPRSPSPYAGSSSNRPPSPGAPAAPPRAAPPAAAPVSRPAAASATPGHGSHGRVPGGGSCRYCGEALPSGRSITYCPHCGQNLTVIHCPACGAELELGWKFCVSCGRSVG